MGIVRKGIKTKNMFIIANFISAVAIVLKMALSFYFFIIFARVIFSWINPAPYNEFVRMLVRFVYEATEPALGRIRAKIPALGGIDLSPMVLIAAVYFLQAFVVGTLFDIARSLRF